MRINCHSHVFSLLDSAGQETIEILVDRIWAELTGHAADTSGLDFTETLRNLQRFMNIGNLRTERILSKLMSQGDDDDKYVLLQIDFNNNSGQYHKQVDDLKTLQQSHPGRVYPFIGYNGQRDGAEAFVQTQLARKTFYGVKCYPSLGYSMTSNKTKPLIDYCAAHALPMMTHCAGEGFHKDENAHLAGPEEWAPLFAGRPGLKVCFAHFGGEKELLKFSGNQASWTRRIVSLMHQYPGQVYADISCHTKPIIWKTHKPKQYQAYMQALRTIVADPTVAPYLLWGTDFYMNHLTTTEAKFQAFWKRELFADAALKKAMCQDNPARYLGIDLMVADDGEQ